MTAITVRAVQATRQPATWFGIVFGSTAVVAAFGPPGWPRGVAVLAFLLNGIIAAASYGVRSWRKARAFDAEMVRLRDARLDGRNVLHAFVRGDSIPVLEAAALAKARELWGAEAVFHVEKVEDLSTSALRDEGAFSASVYVLRTAGGES